MTKRFACIWFPFLQTDWICRTHPEWHNEPVVIVAPEKGRIIITATNATAEKLEISAGMTLADARTFFPKLIVFNDKPGLSQKLLFHLATYCIRFSPVVAIDGENGLIIDITGCTHLWGGEQDYFNSISERLKSLGFRARISLADTIGTAWAVSRYGRNEMIIRPGGQSDAIMPLPPVALRLPEEITQRLFKLGLHEVSNIINISRPALLRRFGKKLLDRLDQSLGNIEEFIVPVIPVASMMERLVCIEPVVTRTGIEIALETLLEKLCTQLQKLEQGFRSAKFTCFRVDGKSQEISIGTNRATHHKNHLFKLFEHKLDTIEPGEGIEVFSLEAIRTYTLKPEQEKLWNNQQAYNETELYELLDRIENRFGKSHTRRYLPAEHHLPERAFQIANSIEQSPETHWNIFRMRPAVLFQKPKHVSVTAPIPDYPPMLFRYKGKLHKVIRADGPERIEQEWWIENGAHRDYYTVEDEEGHRFWIFRLGHYTGDKKDQWFLHGLFA